MMYGKRKTNKKNERFRLELEDQYYGTKQIKANISQGIILGPIP